MGLGCEGGGEDACVFGKRKRADAASRPSARLPNSTQPSTTSNDHLPPQRIVAFFGCLVLGATCLALASLYTPVLMLKARKFALLFTFGSLLILVSLSMLHGPAAYMQYMISKEKLPFTAAYGLTVVATLYTSMVMRSTVYTIPTAAAQVGRWRIRINPNQHPQHQPVFLPL